jgi:signal recognition particle subunit SRP54
MAQMKDQLAEVDDAHLDKVAAIIRSMTPTERANPKIINGSRRARIAAGSGRTVMDVNQLLNRFADAQKALKQVGGMMGLPGGSRKATKSPKNKRKGKGKKGGGSARPRIPRIPGGIDPTALDPRALTGGDDFTPPQIDFKKFRRD